MVNELDARLRRLRRLVLANHAGIWGSVLVLAVLRVWFTDHPTVVRTIIVLTVGGSVLLVASLLVQRRRYGLGAGLIIIANWICAIGATYVTAFITPAGLFGLLLPVVLLFEFLTPAMLRVFISLTVVATGILAGIGEYGRSDEGYEHLPPVITAPIVTFFVVVVVAIVALGLWNQTHRLTEQATELEASRRRLASAADDARRGIERDLHDGAQQRLSTLSVHLGRVKRLIHSDPAAAEAALAQAHTDLMDAIRELRDLAHGIYPALLEQLLRQGALLQLPPPPPPDASPTPAVSTPTTWADTPPRSRTPSTSPASKPCTTPTGTPARRRSASNSQTTQAPSRSSSPTTESDSTPPPPAPLPEAAAA